MTAARAFWGIALFLLLTAGGCGVMDTPAAATCADDSSVTGCGGGAMGFACTGGVTPDQANGSLFCSEGVAGSGPTAGKTLICCVYLGATVTTTCGPDPTVNDCVAPSIGYSCSGTSTPEQGAPSLSCSGDGSGNLESTLFCCQVAPP